MSQSTNKQLIIIADDLTGAMDASGYLAEKGIPISVFPETSFEIGAGITVVNTDSRNDLPYDAARKIVELSKLLRGRAVFKKIDSTLRGNIAVEIVTLLESLSFDKAVVCPAFPAMGRTVENGILKVKGVPVAETDFGFDPVNPVKDSFVPALFKRERYHAGVVTLEEVAKGPEHLTVIFTERNEKVLVCDATQEEYLRNIILAAKTSGYHNLLVGSGGLAREAGLWLDITSANRTAQEIGEPNPALIIVGSRHSASAAQLLSAQAALGLPLLKIDVRALESANSKLQETERLVNEAGTLLEKGKSVAITSTFSTREPGREKEIAAALAGVASALINVHHIAGLFLSGGDTAMAVCRELGVKVIPVYGEVQPGVPAGEIALAKRKIRLVTKAGGFGRETAITESMQYLERGVL